LTELTRLTELRLLLAELTRLTELGLLLAELRLLRHLSELRLLRKLLCNLSLLCKLSLLVSKKGLMLREMHLVCKLSELSLLGIGIKAKAQCSAELTAEPPHLTAAKTAERLPDGGHRIQQSLLCELSLLQRELRKLSLLGGLSLLRELNLLNVGCSHRIDIERSTDPSRHLPKLPSKVLAAKQSSYATTNQAAQRST
jgi:hypothetical protein